MSDQVTLGTLAALDPLLWPVRWDGAGQHAMVIDAGLRGLTASRHGAPDRWDWGGTAGSLLRAQDRERQADRIVAGMTPEQRAALWVGEADTPLSRLLRRVARRTQ